MREGLVAVLAAALSTPAAAQNPIASQGIFDVRCEAGVAAGFPCEQVHLLAYLPLEELGGGLEPGNDLWGYAGDGRELVLMGRGNGTVVVDVTNPVAPRYLGRLGAPSFRSPWRDIKVYQRHAFVVSEAPGHGLQIFDLGAVLDAATYPVEVEPAVHYREMELSSAHNVAINEKSGFAYIVGSNTCLGGLHMVDIGSPKEPSFAGCFSDDGYTHDVQCVSYDGPDRDYRDREICFASNEDTLTIVDVTDKGAARMISRASYPGVSYTHQSWTTEDRLFLLMGDELDEQQFAHNTMTRVWDLADLDRPLLLGSHVADTPAIDHNLYIHEGYAYQANYRAGLRILGLEAVAEGRLVPFGVFDIYPADDAPRFNGAWSVYPFFPSGVVAVSGIEQGLFIVKPELR